MKATVLDHYEVILCGAEEAANVGSVCRAMKTMGLSRLSLAACPSHDEDRVRMLAVHAFDVFESARRFDSLSTALAECSLSAGFTRRRGARRKAFSLSVEDFADLAARRLSTLAGGRVALVFGSERTGLTAPELSLCSLAVHIPTADEFPSLNLAQAVQIACYEIRRHALGGRTGTAIPVSRGEADGAVARISELLRSAGFFSHGDGAQLRDFLRDSVERSGYTVSELRYFEALFRKLGGMASRKTGAERPEPADETPV